MKSYTLPKGTAMTFEYYMNGKVFKHTNTLGETMTFTYNEFRRESTTVNERGYTRKFFFDPSGNPTKIVEETGAEHTYTYDAANPMNRLSKRDPLGYMTQYTYDTLGNVTKSTLPSGSTVEYSHFTAFNQPGKVKDARGNYTLRKYDATGNLLQTIKLKSGLGAAIDPATYTPVASDLVAWALHTYDSYGNVLSAKQVRDFAGQVGPTLEFEYTDTVNTVSGLNVTTITRRGDKDGNGSIDSPDTATLTYDALGRVTRGIRADWYPTQFVYDAVDRIVQGSDDVGNLREYTYDANGNLLMDSLTQTVNGAPTLLDRTVSIFDYADRKLLGIDAGGNVTAFQYDPAGNVLKITNPDGYALGFEYDPGNRAIKAFDQAGHAVTKTLDLAGKPRSMKDPNGSETTFEYYGPEKEGRLKVQRDALNRATTYDYDANGNVSSVTDHLGRTTTTTYDELNRPVRVVGPAYTDAALGTIRPVTRYRYNPLGFLTTVEAGRTDATGTTPAGDVVTPQTTVTYDDFGRPLTETDALGQSRRAEYDRHGNPVRVTDAKGQVTTRTYTYGHQVRTQVDHLGRITTYTRNALGQPVQVETPEVTTSYAYDPTHRLSQVTDRRGGKVLEYRYSAGGLLTRMTMADGTTASHTDYRYDAVGRLTGIWAPTGELVSFVYDAGGRLVEKNFPNGVNTRYAYNSDNTLQQVVNKSGANLMSQHDYTYDGVGNRVTHRERVGTTTTPYQYVYDALSRLTEVRNSSTAALLESYTYDPLGNRTTKTAGGSTVAYVYDAANQLTEIRQGSATGSVLASLSYDANGNLTQKSEGTTTTTLTYDALNRLAQVTGTGQPTQSYVYDHEGKRIQKTVGAAASLYLYSGPDIVAEYCDTWAAASSLTTHGPNMDDPLLRASGSTANYYHQDGLGSVVAVSNGSGGTEGTVRYDAWGSRVATTGVIPQYGYTGREPDGTGLIYYRGRYYDPTLGRFTQRDPIGLQGGLNQYAYVNSNPVNFTDPMGTLAFNPALTNVATGSTSYYASTTSGLSVGLGGLSADWQSLASVTSGTLVAGHGGASGSPSRGPTTSISYGSVARGPYSLNVTEVATILFNETRSLAGEGIGQARLDAAYVIINGVLHSGAGRPQTADAAFNVAPNFFKPPAPAEQFAFGSSVIAAASALYQRTEGAEDPTQGALHFALRQGDTVRQHGLFGAVSTQTGPFNNSFPSQDLGRHDIYVDTFFGGLQHRGAPAPDFPGR